MDANSEQELCTRSSWTELGDAQTQMDFIMVSKQGDEIAKVEPFLQGFDCSDLEWMLHEGTLGYDAVELSTDEPWIAPGRTGALGHLHNDPGTGAEGSGQELKSSKSGVESGRLCAGCAGLRRRCGFGSSVDSCSGSDGGRSDRTIERSGFDSWRREREKEQEKERERERAILLDSPINEWYNETSRDDTSSCRPRASQIFKLTVSTPRQSKSRVCLLVGSDACPLLKQQALSGKSQEQILTQGHKKYGWHATGVFFLVGSFFLCSV